MTISNQDGFIDELSKIFCGRPRKCRWSRLPFGCNKRVITKSLQLALEKVPSGAVTVLEDAAYHCARSSNAPKSCSTVKFMKEWLYSRWFSEHLLVGLNKKDVWEHCKNELKEGPSFAIDEIVAEKGVKLLRLPPYYCEITWKLVVAFLYIFKLTGGLSWGSRHQKLSKL